MNPRIVASILLTVCSTSVARASGPPVYRVEASAAIDGPDRNVAAYIPFRSPQEFYVRTSEPWFLAGMRSNLLPTELSIVFRPTVLQPGKHVGHLTLFGRIDNTVLAYVHVTVRIIPRAYLTDLRATPDSTTLIHVTNTADVSTRVDMQFFKALDPAASRGTGSAAWHYPFADRSPSDKWSQLLGPKETITLRTREVSQTVLGWAEFVSDQTLVVRSELTSRNRHANPSTTNVATFPALLPQIGRQVSILDSGAGATTSAILINPNDQISRATVRAFDYRGLSVGPELQLALPPQQLVTLDAHDILGPYAAVFGTGVVEVVPDHQPIAVASVRRTALSTQVIAAATEDTTNKYGRLMLTRVGNSDASTIVVNTANSTATGLVASCCRAGASPSSALSLSVPAFGMISPDRLSGAASWAAITFPASVKVHSKLASAPVTTAQVWESASTPTTGSVMLLGGSGAQMALVNTADREGTFLVVSRGHEFREPLTIRLSGRTKAYLDLPTLGHAIPVLWEVVNVDGVRIVASIVMSGAANTVAQPVTQ